MVWEYCFFFSSKLIVLLDISLTFCVFKSEELEFVRSELGFDLAFFLKSKAIDGTSFYLSLRKLCIYY